MRKTLDELTVYFLEFVRKSRFFDLRGSPVGHEPQIEKNEIFEKHVLIFLGGGMRETLDESTVCSVELV